MKIDRVIKIKDEYKPCDGLWDITDGWTDRAGGEGGGGGISLGWGL